MGRIIDNAVNTFRVFCVTATGARKTHRCNWLHNTGTQCMLELLDFAWSYHLAEHPDARNPFSNLELSFVPRLWWGARVTPAWRAGCERGGSTHEPASGVNPSSSACVRG